MMKTKFVLTFLFILSGLTLSAQSAVYSDGQVFFRYNDTQCTQAYVAGTFNGWTAEQSPMKRDSNGTWTYQTSLPYGQVLKYKFKADDRWVTTRDLYEPGGEGDDFGGYLGVVNTIPPPPPRYDEFEAEDYFLPGLSASLAQPFEGEKLYTGLNFHYTLLTGVVEGSNDDFGGYYSVYTEIGYYKEQESSPNDDIFFITQMGISMSFEKMNRRTRNILIPYFGARFGSIVFQGNSPGLLVEPLLGIVAFYFEPAILKYDASLMLSSVNLDTTIGLRHSLALSVNF